MVQNKPYTFYRERSSIILFVETLAENTRQILGLQLTPEQLAAFERYKKELIEWNNRFNLTAIRDESAIEIKHFRFANLYFGF